MRDCPGDWRLAVRQQVGTRPSRSGVITHTAHIHMHTDTHRTNKTDRSSTTLSTVTARRCRGLTPACHCGRPRWRRNHMYRSRRAVSGESSERLACQHAKIETCRTRGPFLGATRVDLRVTAFLALNDLLTDRSSSTRAWRRHGHTAISSFVNLSVRDRRLIGQRSADIEI